MLRTTAISVAMLGLHGQAFAQVETSRIWEENKAGIAQITVTYRDVDGQPLPEHGSGFVVDREGHVVTAGHVVKPPANAAPGQSPKIIVKLGGEVAAIEAHVVPMSFKGDVAVLQLAHASQHGRDAWPYLTLVKNADVTPASSLAAVGFPAGGSEMWSAGTLGGNAATCGGRTASRWLSATLEAGASGGPVFDQRGRVYALIEGGAASVCDTFGSMYPSTQGLIIPVEVLDFCRAPVTCTFGAGGAAYGRVGNLLANDGRPWYQRLAAGSGSFATKRFGVSMRDLERSPFTDLEPIMDQLCSVLDKTDACLLELERDARSGDPFALSLWALRRMYMVGPDGDEDALAALLPEVINDLEAAAAREFPFAQATVGLLLLDGMGFIGSDPVRGKALLEAAIAQDWGGASWSIVKAVYDRPEYLALVPSPVDALEHASRRGIPDAQGWLALALLRGHGYVDNSNGTWTYRSDLRNHAGALGFTVARDAKRGFKLLETAVEGGYEDSGQLARIYRWGRFAAYPEQVVEPDPSYAYNLFKKCGIYICEAQAAAMLYSGHGVARDKAKAIAFFQDAAKKNLLMANEVLQEIQSAGGTSMVHEIDFHLPYY